MPGGPQGRASGTPHRAPRRASAGFVTDLFPEEYEKEPPIKSLSDEFRRQVAVQGLALSLQNWEDIGNADGDPAAAVSTDLEVCVERITSLLLVRVVAIVASQTPSTAFNNLSTSSICRKVLIDADSPWPVAITDQVVQELRQFVRTILQNYDADLPFHNFQHAYHVIVSANKLMDLMLNLDSNDFMDDRPPPAFGLRHDPMALAGLIFAALVHDVDHKGVSNRQLILEDHPLALLYNDNSINEHRSLQLAFQELLKDQYTRLRNVMFPNPGDYRFFRVLVIDMVLSTDIASPERSQISKSKWKEGFTFIEGDMDGDPNQQNMSPVGNRRGSLMSDISMPRAGRSGVPSPPMNRRGSNASNNSMMSEVTFDSYTMLMKHKKAQGYAQGYNNTATTTPRRNSPFEDDDMSPDISDTRARMPSTPPRPSPRLASRRNSTQSYNTLTDDSFDSFAQESIGLAQKRQGGRAATRAMRMERLAGAKFDTGIGSGGGGGDDSHESNSSISLTPPSSDDEDAPVRGVMVTRSAERLPGAQQPNGTSNTNRPSLPRSRRASTGNVPIRFGSLEGQRIDENAVINESFRKLSVVNKLDRRATLNAAPGYSSSGSQGQDRYRKRLGILRSMDFSGESIEVYSRGSIGGSSLAEGMFSEDVVFDEPDELRASVVLELMLRAADVGHCLQSWENMAKWSSCLFNELAKAYKSKRGHDPAPGWFDNQAKALESYVLPLAFQLDETGVFGEFVGAVFSQRVESNRDKWLVTGFELTQTLRDEAGL